MDAPATVAWVAVGTLPAHWPWMLLALAVLAGAFVMANRSRQPLQQAVRPIAPRISDDRLALALWASGELYWEYDLGSRHLLYWRPDEDDDATNGLALHVREGSLPPIHPQDLDPLTQALRDHVRGVTPLFMTEIRVDLSGNGAWTWVRIRGRAAAHGADGRVLRIAGGARDISTVRNTEHQHRIASEVMRSMSEAVAVLDWDRHFIAVNPSMCRITGYTSEELIGKPIFLLNSPQHDNAFFQRIKDELKREGRWTGVPWILRKDGEELLCQVEANVVPDVSGQRQMFVVVFNDITEQKRVEQELRYLANYDTLTSLPNRSLLSERLSRAIVRARRMNNYIAVLFIDLDRFKDINDSLGHATGDRILRAAAARVQQTVGVQHTVARLGGDEFTVVLEDIRSAQEAEQVAQQIIEAFSTPLAFGERLDLTVSPSIGISLYPNHAQVPTDLLKHADTAMYQAKASGRHTWQMYSEAMDEKTRHRAILASGLRRALERGELSLVYQPRLSLRQQRIVGVEALMRWNSHEFGEVPPSLFIPLAEESGLILDFGVWALRQACHALRRWHDAGLDQMCVSVNVSALQLQRGDLPDVVAQVLAETGLDARFLELELTESVIMSQSEQNAGALRACRNLGVSLAIDDFGTGYSSLAYLKRLPITTLKIDREFIDDLTRDNDDDAITSTIIAMGHSLSKTVVAEGVETAEQLDFLSRQLCDEIQGHHICHALPADQCLDFIRNYYPKSAIPAAPSAARS
ncbi:MAG: EAL domain-containing protein [Pseudoxanthomonas sp.]